MRLANCGPQHPKGAVVGVTLADGGGGMMGAGNAMMVSVDASPHTVPAGTVTFVATNVGTINHELLVLPAPADGIGTRTVGTDGKIDEATSLGEASTSCGRGIGQGISPGATSWVTLRLAPGNYELLCDEPWHYANGMFTWFTVR
ncbi:MAG: sulfocyanin-like copper-binding protein [Hyphomicrobiales bacterium]